MSGNIAHNGINYRHRYECGAVTLTITLILLFLLSLITFYGARVGVIEQKITANEYRAKQAFEAAQAGIEIGTTYLNNRIYRKQLISDSDNDGLVDLNQTDITSGFLPNNASYMITYNNIGWRNDFRLIEIDSIGWSDDQTASARISQALHVIPLLLTMPDASATSHGDITMEGNIGLVNTETDITAKSGDSVTLHDDSQATTSDPSNNGIEENNPELQGLLTNDEFFDYFFGVSKADAMLQNIHMTCDESSCLNQDDQIVNPDEYPGENIWISGNTTITSDVGSEEHPVILIIDGDLTLNGDLTIWGLIYITEKGHTIHASGNGYLHGGLITEDNDFHVNGNLTIEYDLGVITPPKGGNGLFTKIAGTWRDF